MTRPVPQLLSRPSPEEVELEGELLDLDRAIDEWSRAVTGAMAARAAVRRHGGIDRDALRQEIAETLTEATYAARKAITRRLEGEDNGPY